MNNPYLIALDLDGTLLTDKRKISFLTRKYLKNLANRGHIIVLSSGRPRRVLLKYAKLLNLKTPMIAYNGTYIFSPFDNNFPTFQNFISPGDAISLRDEFKNLIQNYCLENNNEMYFLKEDKYLTRYFWDKNMNLCYGEISKTLKTPQMTMIIKCDKNVDELDENEIRNIVQKYDDLDVRFWFRGPYFEITFKGTSKGSAVKYIADYYHVPLNRVIAFGDEENDLSMLKIAGYPYLMKNSKLNISLPNLKRTKCSNNALGVYFALKSFFKK